MAPIVDFRMSNAEVNLFALKNLVIQCAITVVIWWTFELVVPIANFDETPIAYIVGFLFFTFIGFAQFSSRLYIRLEWRQHDLRLHHMFGTVDVPIRQIRSIRFSTPNLVTRIFLTSGEYASITLLKNKNFVKYAVPIEKYSIAVELRARLLELTQLRESEQSAVAEPTLKAARIS